MCSVGQHVWVGFANGMLSIVDGGACQSDCLAITAMLMGQGGPSTLINLQAKALALVCCTSHSPSDGVCDCTDYWLQMASRSGFSPHMAPESSALHRQGSAPILWRLTAASRAGTLRSLTQAQTMTHCEPLLSVLVWCYSQCDLTYNRGCCIVTDNNLAWGLCVCCSGC